MAAITVTKFIQELLEKATLESCTALTTDEKSALAACLESGEMGMTKISLLKKYLDIEHKLHGQHISLAECLRGAEAHIITPKKRVGAEDPALRKRREFLNLEREKKEYNRMVFGQEEAPQDQASESFGAQYRSFNNQISVLLNMIMAIIVSFGIAYFIACKYFEHQSQRMMVGLVGAILMMMVEMLLYILRSARAEKELEGKQGGSSSHGVLSPISSAPITMTDHGEESSVLNSGAKSPLDIKVR